ncbi:hypothetical protein B0H17DRAFT_133182 [Mycena rosella]|uniref:Thioredoxin domain-containing protein n=1 Tax=Mycena rosella TaxID=1033263 RepID=A0AAD7D289_MYCRO|nr:hypothetical protein B0H17DRAFT_133182 [Mycena rosella]
MPLNVADGIVDPASLKDRPEEFLIFYSDVVEGKMWCPDCRKVDELVRETFAGPDAPAAVIVYVGNKPEWKALDNKFRGEPFKIDGVPTIVRLKEKEEVGRLVDDEISSKLSAFVEGSKNV